MNRFACFAFVVFSVQISLTETGLIKDVITSFSGARKNTKPSQNYSPDPDYKNTTWFIENEDYLSPNTNTSGHNRPNGSHHNSGFSNGPNTGTSSQYGNQRPGGSHHSGGFSNRPPNYGNFPSSPSSSNRYERRLLENENRRDLAGEQLLTPDHSKREAISSADEFGKPDPFIPEDTPAPEHVGDIKTRSGDEWDDGNHIILTDDSVTCCYSNIKDDRIENRHLRCNEKDCVLGKISEKSSFWVCKGIKCSIANVDFTKNVENKRLIECSMDGRNLIQTQDKPLRCPPGEREVKGRCRKIWGSDV